MKLLAIAFTALVAFATVESHYLPPFGKGPLYEDIQYFIDMIPMEDVVDTVLQYAAEDAEFQELINYFSTDEFKLMLQEVENIKEFHDFADYLQTSGVYIYDSLNRLNKVVGLPPFHQTFASSKQITGGVKGLFEDVKKLISYDKFIKGYVYKMRTSDAFRGFVAHLKSDGNQKFVNALYSSNKFLHFRGMLVNRGIDIVLIEDIIYTVLGVEFPIFEMPYAFYENQLSKDIHDFTKLIDLDKIGQIVLSYLDDDEVQKALEYMYGEEFHQLVRQVEALPEYQDLVLYLHDAGLDVFGLIQKVHKIMGMEDYVPPKHTFGQLFVNRGGVKGLVDAVIAVLPRDKFRALYQEKMATSPAFKTFVEKLQGPEFQKIVNAIYASPIFLEMRQKSIDAGLNLAPVREIIENIIGVHLPTVPAFYMFANTYENQLSKDIHDFTKLIDLDKIGQIVLSYLDDDEVQKALEYMYGEEFHQLVRQVEALPEYQDLVLYLHDAGLDVFDLIQKVHKIMGMEDYVPPKHTFGQLFVNRGGVKGLVDAVIAVLPRDKFRALYQEKMATSPAFKTFVEKLQGPEFQKIVNAIYASPIFLEMRQKSIDAGLNLAPVREIIENIIGVHLPTVPAFYMFANTYENQLSKDIHDFTKLIDLDKIGQIVLSYLDDDEVQKALEYMYSEEFHQLVRQVEALPEYQDLVLYLHDAGLDVFGLIQKVHKIMGMEDYVPPTHNLKSILFGHLFVNRGGVKGLVDAVIAVLPRDKFRALYQEKMATSPAFKTFVEKLQGPEFQKIVNAIYASPIFLEMRQKSIDAGLNLAPVREIIENIIGVHLPTVPAFYMFANTYENQLSKDIHDFTKLIDLDKIGQIVLSYLDDDEVQKALEYMYGEEFHQLVRQVEALPEYQDLVLYLHDAGLDVFDLIQKVHKIMGMEDYVPPKHTFGQLFVNRGGVKGLVDAVIAVLPRDKFRALYQEKMATSPAFKTFVEKLQGPEFQKIVNAIYASPIFLEMRQKSIDAGLNLAPVREIIENIIGVHLPTVPAFYMFANTYENQLSKDIHDFTKLIDLDKIGQIVLSYLDDDEVQKALEYMYSEEFHQLVRQVEALPEYQDLVLYLHDAGLDVFGLIQKVHKIMGMEDYVPPTHNLKSILFGHLFVNRGGVKGLVDAVIAVLPRDKFRALYQEKMATSPAFKTFVEKLQGPEFQKIVNAIYASPIFLEMRQKTIDAGLNLAPVREIIENIIGVHLPTVPVY
ncbi:Protein G12 [Anthophora quadrimaculata]